MQGGFFDGSGAVDGNGPVGLAELQRPQMGQGRAEAGRPHDHVSALLAVWRPTPPSDRVTLPEIPSRHPRNTEQP